MIKTVGVVVLILKRLFPGYREVFTHGTLVNGHVSESERPVCRQGDASVRLSPSQCELTDANPQLPAVIRQTE